MSLIVTTDIPQCCGLEPEGEVKTCTFEGCEKPLFILRCRNKEHAREVSGHCLDRVVKWWKEGDLR